MGADEWEEQSTPDLPPGQIVVMRVRGNRSIARALRTFADEAQRGTMLSLEANYRQGDEFLARARFNDLVDVEALNLPGEVRVYASSAGEAAKSRSVLTDIGPPERRVRRETAAPEKPIEDEDTDVQTPQRRGRR